MREYREKYAINDHGMPNPDAKKLLIFIQFKLIMKLINFLFINIRPSRGDFMIHPDWHAGLKHHHLPCDC